MKRPWLLFLLGSAALLSGGGGAQAQTPPAPGSGNRVIGQIKITLETPRGGTPTDLTGPFKRQLAAHGWKANDCSIAREGLQVFKKSQGYDQGDDAHGLFVEMERKIVEQQCSVPAQADSVFVAELTLTVEPELKNKKRATLRLISLGPVMMPTLSGGYSHKAGEAHEWEQMMSGAIERTVGRYNEDTAIHLGLPQEAKVGETIDVDGSDTWDLDGDTFELRWSLATEACVDGSEPLPVDSGCPLGMRRAAYEVRTDAGGSELKRRFVPPLVGTYQLEVRSKVGSHESPPVIRQVRVYPKRPRSIYWRLIQLQLPANYIRTGQPQEPALWLRTGYMARLLSRVGILGVFEEIHVGGFIATLNAPKDYLGGDVGGTFAGLEITTRALKNDGRLGLSNSIYGAGGFLIAQRGDWTRIEYLWSVQTNLLLYYSFGPNYTNTFARYCSRTCFDATIGPVVGYWHNTATGKQALIGGLEFGTAVTF